MLEIDYAFNLIIKALKERTDELGFKLDYPEGVRPPQVPMFEDDKVKYIIYRGEKGRIKIEYSESRIAFYCTSFDDDCSDEDMPRISLSLLELDTYDERDLRYIFDEYLQTIDKYYGVQKTLSGKVKLPTPVSKSAAKTGALSYDSLTLGNRFVGIYQEYKGEYRDNIEKYGEFLAEEFFIEHGNKTVIETIKENNKIKMRKLFNLLNDIYEDGTNETQSLITVTVLGELYKYPELLSNAKEHMSEDLAETVQQVVNFLSSGKSKGARMRLENPPPYKPPKKKRESALMKMMGM